MAARTRQLGVSHGSNLKTAFHHSQQAPVILGQQSSGRSLSGLYILNQEGSDDFDALEKLFFSCIQSTDDESALLCLERLTQRFGSSNERVMALRGLYDEATAESQTSLELSLKRYDDILSQDPVNLPILKRRIALLRSLSKTSDAISSLVKLLDATPTDVEAWCELAELYQSQGMSPQAIFSLEEALLIVPHAWNVHARLGEILYIYACSLEGEAMYKQLQLSIRHFCRSVELCDDYLRGFYGLALATSPSLVNGSSELTVGKDTLFSLHALARRKLEQTLSRENSKQPHLREYDENELSAVKKLLGRL
ncbi:hypothetical protein BJX63DRAFT_140542 [Aspergillus granulosus]|uniref:ER membrane protein complex subunit 2 n=1 Tax=Aspergillus granulosus TaxID=176169 RepID=A0ABR4GS53_9EURO